MWNFRKFVYECAINKNLVWILKWFPYDVWSEVHIAAGSSGHSSHGESTADWAHLNGMPHPLDPSVRVSHVVADKVMLCLDYLRLVCFSAHLYNKVEWSMRTHTPIVYYDIFVIKIIFVIFRPACSIQHCSRVKWRSERLTVVIMWSYSRTVTIWGYITN